MTAATDTQPRSPRAVTGVVLSATVAVAAVGVLAALLLPLQPLPGAPAGAVRMSWWVFAVLYVCVLSVDIMIMVRREAQMLTLTEIPLVLSLVFASPAHAFVGRVVGTVVAYAIVRRQYRQPRKLMFNVVGSVDVLIAFAIFNAVMNGAVLGGPRTWVAAVAGVLFVSLLMSFVTSSIIAYVEDAVSTYPFLRTLAQSTAEAMTMTVVAIVASEALLAEPLTAIPLVALGGVLFLAYRAYSVLHQRHLSLERLYRFSQVVNTAPQVTEVLRRILEQAKEVLQAETARITFLPTDSIDGVDLTLPLDNQLVQQQTVDVQRFAWVFDTVVRRGQPLLIPRGTRDPASRHLLEELGLQDAMFVPFRGEAGVAGLLSVGNRLAYARGFGRDDIRVLETVANHAAVALRNGRLIDQLRHESLHDALTGLPNRTYLQRELDTKLQRFNAEDPQGLAVMIIDLDRFKEVNDTLGHQHGDELLQEVARRMSSVAEGRALLARLGGDEFAVVLDPCPSEERALNFARALMFALQAPVALDDVEVEVGGSIGVALAPEHAADRVRLLKRADLAMYAAKDSGRGVCLFEASMDRSNPQRLALVGELRQAIALESLEIVFQPKAELRTGQVVGSEALARWQHPIHGAVNPEEFIPLAERSGLIRPLTSFVLRGAIAACAGWQDVAPGVGVSVNLSARSVADDDIVEDVLRLLRRYDLPPALVTLELTEGSIMADPVRTIGVLHALSDAGIRLSIDDFGTGYSSLSYLRRLPVHEVKIDKSFVQGITGHEGDDGAIVRSIVDLGHHLALEVVAEGVETLETWQVLAEMGCAQAQGYLMSRPLPSSDFVAWLRAHRDHAVAPPVPVPPQPVSSRHLRAL